MHSILVKHVDGPCAGDVSILALDISAPGDAWGIIRNIATSYDQHGIDKNEVVYWFKNAAGLHHMWTEQTNAATEFVNVSSPPLSERVSSLLLQDNTAYSKWKQRTQRPSRQAA